MVGVPPDGRVGSASSPRWPAPRHPPGGDGSAPGEEMITAMRARARIGVAGLLGLSLMAVSCVRLALLRAEAPVRPRTAVESVGSGTAGRMGMVDASPGDREPPTRGAGGTRPRGDGGRPMG